MSEMRRKLQQAVLLAVCTSATGSAWAEKFNAEAGYFRLTGKTSSGSTNLANFGRYDLAYRFDFADHVQASVGYSLYMLGTDTADIGFGLDLGAYYFPWTRPGSRSYATQTIKYATEEVFRPFIGLEFIQRQFQSVQSGYAGLQVSIGAEYQMTESYYVLGRGIFGYLNGPLDSSLTENAIMAGIGYMRH